MNLAERLKQVREKLGYTQKEMAKAVSVILQTWQVYEAGKSVPGGNVFEALARMGFNVNWILTGEGEMMREASDLILSHAPGKGMSEKFKNIRGDRSVKNFVRRMYMGGSIRAEDQERLEDEIRAIENNKKQPDWTLISIICREYGISTSWIIEDEGPMLKKDIYLEYVLNADVLRQILMEADVYEAVNPGSLLPDKKSQLIAELYQMRMKKQTP